MDNASNVQDVEFEKAKEAYNGQTVYVVFVPEMHGLKVTDSMGLTKGKVINNCADNTYNVEIKLGHTKSIQQFVIGDIYDDLQQAVYRVSKQYDGANNVN